MAATAAAPPPSHPQKVAQHFVKTYYNTLRQNPSVLYCFYRPESQVSPRSCVQSPGELRRTGEKCAGAAVAARATETKRRSSRRFMQRKATCAPLRPPLTPFGTQASQAFLDEVQPAPVQGRELRDQLTSFFSEHLKGCHVDFDEGSVDAQAASDETVFVMVFGVAKSLDGSAPDRRFVQSFLLRFMENRYFILNDMFRFTHPTAAGEAAATEALNGRAARGEVEDDAAEQIASAATSREGDDIDAGDADAMGDEANLDAAVLANGTADAAADASANGDVNGDAEDGANGDAKTSVVPSEKAEGGAGSAADVAIGSGPVSWAKIASRAGEAPPSTVSPVRKLTVPPANPSAKLASGSSSSGESKATGGRAVNGTSDSTPSKRSTVPGIYIRNVNADTSDAEIETLFSGEWGKAERVLSHAAKGFAFVEFATLDSVRAIVSGEAQEEWILRGEKLVVEERRERDPNRSSTKRRPQNGYPRSSSARNGARGGRSARGEPRRNSKSANGDGERSR